MKITKISQRLVKTAKYYDVEYSIGFSPDIFKKRVRVDPSEDQSDVERRLQKQHKTRDSIIIDKYFPVGQKSKKTRPSLKDQQRMRGKRLRDERAKKAHQKELENQQKQLDALKISPDKMKLIQEMEQQDEDTNFLDMLRSKQRAVEEQEQRANTPKALL